MNLTEAQREQLLRPINPRRVGSDGKGFAHLEAYDVRAHLSRIFGIGAWSCRVLVMEQVFESSEQRTNKKNEPYTAWTVCYRAQVELTVGAGAWISGNNVVLAVYTEWATGDATNMPSRADAHDMAIKTAESQALKRCAVNLGDQFGLSLYAKGSTAAVVKAVIPWAAEQVEVEHEVVPESLERPGMPAKEGAETNGVSQQERTVASILSALSRKDGEKPSAWVNRVTKAQVDANRYGVTEVEVDGVPLTVTIGNALADAMAELSPA